MFSRQKAASEMWTNKLKGALVTSRQPKAMDAVLKGCQQIMQEHGSGQTEAFYHRMLEIYLYDRGIPCLKEVDCFTMAGAVPVLVGRIDLEVDHTIILELKIGSKIQGKHLQQVRKYAHARKATGMNVQVAAVICFTDHETVEIQQLLKA